MQMQLSHKRARVELERAASTSARSYEVSAGQLPWCSGNPALGLWAARPALLGPDPSRASPRGGQRRAGPPGFPSLCKDWGVDLVGIPGGMRGQA